MEDRIMLTPLPRILFITPDLIFFPDNSATDNKVHRVGRGKKIDFFANLVNELYHFGIDIYIAQPEYRKLSSFFSARYDKSGCSDIPRNRLHLVRDRIFYYCDDIDSNRDGDNFKISIALQREIIHHLIPMIQPDLIHCHDWMAGLIPAAARCLGIPCLFTVYDIRSKQIPLCHIEDMGIDAANFWETLFYHRMPICYEETREVNPVDFLLSGINAADCVSAASLGFASELLNCQAGYNKTAFGQLLTEKCKSGCVSYNYHESLNTQEYIDLYNTLLRDVATESAGY